MLFTFGQRDRKKKRFYICGFEWSKFEKKAIDDLQDVEWMGREIRVNDSEKRDRPNNKKYNKFNISN